VLQIADNEMNSLHQQRRACGAADRCPRVILNCVTAPGERRIFERAGLWLGADWSEAREGTNGIGTCLVERQALTIHQASTFVAAHRPDLLGQPGVRPPRRTAGGARRVVGAAGRVAPEPVPHHGLVNCRRR
jgi:hypothetical protein